MKKRYLFFMILGIIVITCFCKLKMTFDNYITDSKTSENNGLCMHRYENTQYLLNDKDKNLIIKEMHDFDIFNLKDVAISDYAILRISGPYFDGDTFGSITLFVDSSFSELEEIIKTNFSNDILTNYDSSISIKGNNSTISFYIDDNGKNRLYFTTELPVCYKVDELDNYNDFIKYFFKLNNK